MKDDADYPGPAHARRRAVHLDEAARLGRRTLWERSLDEIDDKVLQPAPDCFACEHLRAGDACGLVAKLALGKTSLRVAARIVDLVEYRAYGQSDPNRLCDGFEMASSIRKRTSRPMLPPFDK